jgi:isoleucyl-tRNA synthetase
MGRVVQAGSEVHNYPYCWRSDTPLIYKAVSTWFIKVTNFK